MSRLPLLRALPKQSPAPAFSTLTHQQRQVAEQWLWKFCQRWGSDLPQWRRAILIGVAKRLALHPTPPGWSYSLRQTNLAHAAVRKLQREGRDIGQLLQEQKAKAKARRAEAAQRARENPRPVSTLAPARRRLLDLG